MKFTLIAIMISVMSIKAMAEQFSGVYEIYGPLAYQSYQYGSEKDVIHARATAPNTTCEAMLRFQKITSTPQDKVSLIGNVEMLGCTDALEQQRFTGKGRVAIMQNDTSDSDLMVYFELKSDY